MKTTTQNVTATGVDAVDVEPGRHFGLAAVATAVLLLPSPAPAAVSPNTLLERLANVQAQLVEGRLVSGYGIACDGSGKSHQAQFNNWSNTTWNNQPFNNWPNGY